MFDLNKLLIDVFDPQAGELVAVVVDEPTDAVPDHDGWRARREMAEEWRQAPSPSSAPSAVSRSGRW